MPPLRTHESATDGDIARTTSQSEANAAGATATIPVRDDDGPGPDSPAQLHPRSWKPVLNRVRERIIRDRVSLSAGSLAYHWLLALFPAIIALLGLLTLLQLSHPALNHLVHGVDTALPSGVSGVFDSAVKAATTRSQHSGTAFVLGLLLAVWSSSAGVSALQQALDVAYEVPTDRKFLARRIRALPIMLAIAVLGGIGGTLVVFGQPIGAAIDGHLPLHGLAFTVVWQILRWLITLIAVGTLFSTIYFVGPNRKTPTWEWVSVGGLVGTAIFIAASIGFSFYVSKFGNYGRTYGTFAGIVILSFWLYLTGLAILIGGELNAELEREAASETEQEGQSQPVGTASAG